MSSLESTSPLPGSSGPTKSTAPSRGFFSIYKRGQGYWTRLGTAIGLGVIFAFVGSFIYRESEALIRDNNVRLGVTSGFAIFAGLTIWWLVNGTRRCQFLIDTDAEMKKVNWSTWSQLVGATRIVVIFMIAIAVMLFAFDIIYQLFFYLIDIWKISPLEMFGGSPTPAE